MAFIPPVTNIDTENEQEVETQYFASKKNEKEVETQYFASNGHRQRGI